MWDSILTRCGDAFYYDTSADSSFFSHRGLIQYRDVQFYVFARPISRADQLNGIQWQGTAVMTAALYRSTGGSDQRDEIGSSWSQWVNGKPMADVLKGKNPGFYIHDHSGHGDMYQPSGWFNVHFVKRDGNWSFTWNTDKALGFAELAKLKPSCSIVPGTPEFQAAQKQKQQAEEEAKREKEEAERREHEEAVERNRAFNEAARRARNPQTDLERRSQSDGYWIDASTRLMWTAQDSGNNLGWNTWRRYCAGLKTAGHSDWRGPTINELQTLSDATASHDFYDWAYSRDMESHPYHIRGGIMLSWPEIWSTSPAGPNIWLFNFSRSSRVSQYAGVARAICVRSAE